MAVNCEQSARLQLGLHVTECRHDLRSDYTGTDIFGCLSRNAIGNFRIPGPALAICLETKALHELGSFLSKWASPVRLVFECHCATELHKLVARHPSPLKNQCQR
jgi:hypothetical protein